MVMTRGIKRRLEEEEQQQRDEQSQILALPSPQVLPFQEQNLHCECLRRLSRNPCRLRMAKGLRKCENLVDIVVKVAKSDIISTSLTEPSVEEPLRKVRLLDRVYSRGASGRFRSQRARRVPCIRGQSTDAKSSIKKEFHVSEGADGTPVDATAYDGIQCVDVCSAKIKNVEGGSEKIHAITPDTFPVDAINEDLIGTLIPIDTEGTSASTVMMAYDIVEYRPETSANSSRNADSGDEQATSLNLSEMAQLQDDGCSSFSSDPSDAMVIVEGHKVKENLEPILRRILSKYGDIAARCKKKSTAFRSMLVENVCSIVYKLRTTEFVYLTPTEVENLRDLVLDMESDDMEVSWLRKRLDEIYEAKRLLRESPLVKKTKCKSFHFLCELDEEIQVCAEEMHKLQDKMDSLKGKQTAATAEEGKIDKILGRTKTMVRRFHCGFMIDDLL